MRGEKSRGERAGQRGGTQPVGDETQLAEKAEDYMERKAVGEMGNAEHVIRAVEYKKCQVKLTKI